MVLSRISLIKVRAAVQQCGQRHYPLFNYTRLFVRDYGRGWFDERHRFAFGRDN
jgi:hypothetical protein